MAGRVSLRLGAESYSRKVTLEKLYIFEAHGRRPSCLQTPTVYRSLRLEILLVKTFLRILVREVTGRFM